MKNINRFILLLLLPLTILVAQEDVAVTITNQNMALVREKRTVTLQKGLQEIKLQEIPAEIDPSSVLVEESGNRFRVLEQNYEFDLIDVDKLLDKSINYDIRLIHPDQGTIEGRLLSFSRQNVVLLDQDDKLQVIPRNDQQRIMLLDFETTRSNFTSRPTLVWLVEAKNSGAQDMNLSYLTRSMDWSADYVGMLNREDTKLSIAGWVTVTNKSGRDFQNTRLKLMAGDLNILKPSPTGVQSRMKTLDDVVGSGAQLEQKRFFEYHLYTLGRKTNLKNNQVKQIELFPEVTSRIEKRYKVTSNDAKSVKIVVSLLNSEENNLGNPLPEGRIRLYKTDGEDVEFVGENRIRHTPKNEKIDIEVGSAFDIVSERDVLSTDRKIKRTRRQTVEYTLRNHKESSVLIEVEERFSPYYEVTLHKSSHPLLEKKAGYLKFEVTVPADEEATLTMDYSTSW